MTEMPTSQRNIQRLVPLLGVLASLFLHVLMLAPVLLGIGSATNRDPDQLVALGSSSRDDQTMTVVWIEDSDQAQSRQRSAHSTAALPAAENTLLDSVAPPQFLPPLVADLSNSDSNGPDSETSIGTDAGYVLMLGRYLNQINARVERAWIRPRNAIDSELFRCRARITQEHNGDVKEIELDNCNGDSAWQVSLVRAIESASPLPAPPDPRVFSRVLIVDFQSRPFSSDQDAESFELQPTAMK
jgi:TonB-like protein